MVVTRTELFQVVEQINKKFEELESRIKELENKKQPVKKRQHQGQHNYGNTKSQAYTKNHRQGWKLPLY